MPKPTPASTTTIVWDAKTGRLVTVKGIGALKGRMMITKTIDLTKPIFAQSRA